MHHHYKTTILLSLLLSPGLATAQLKAVQSTDVQLNAFRLAPFPVELLHMQPLTGGGVALTSLMPIAGRTLPKTETPKPRGAEFSANATYVHVQSFDAAGQPTTAEGAVFALNQPAGPDTDWAVFGTNATDGPQRLPFGGDPGGLTARFPQTRLPNSRFLSGRITSAVAAYKDADYKACIEYAFAQTTLDPLTGKLIRKPQGVRPLAAENAPKLAGYVGDAQYYHAFPIGAEQNRFETTVARFDAADKTARYRQYHALSFGADGALLRDQPVTLAFNRELSHRIPVHNETGQAVGTLNVLGSSKGKKSECDPVDNRIGAFITDETGGLWAQFDWVVNGGSQRAAIPFFARRMGERTQLFLFNAQKFISPVYETWELTRTGKDVTAKQLATLTEAQILALSQPVGKLVNAGEQAGWSSVAAHQYVDSFTDEGGDAWVVLQRYTSRGMTTGGVEPPMRYGDLFVLHFDQQMTLKHQTVLGLPETDTPVEATRLTRYPDGGAWVFTHPGGNELVRLHSAAKTPIDCQNLTPGGCRNPAQSPARNVAYDPDTDRLYVLYSLVAKPGLYRLLQFALR